ncbi:hypothetical protein HK102_009932, partial [Quaeritorhiza haematococci]
MLERRRPDLPNDALIHVRLQSDDSSWPSRKISNYADSPKLREMGRAQVAVKDEEDEESLWVVKERLCGNPKSAEGVDSAIELVDEDENSSDESDTDESREGSISSSSSSSSYSDDEDAEGSDEEEHDSTKPIPAVPVRIWSPKRIINSITRSSSTTSSTSTSSTPSSSSQSTAPTQQTNPPPRSYSYHWSPPTPSVDAVRLASLSSRKLHSRLDSSSRDLRRMVLIQNLLTRLRRSIWKRRDEVKSRSYPSDDSESDVMSKEEESEFLPPLELDLDLDLDFKFDLDDLVEGGVGLEDDDDEDAARERRRRKRRSMELSKSLLEAIADEDLKEFLQGAFDNKKSTSSTLTSNFTSPTGVVEEGENIDDVTESSEKPLPPIPSSP